MVTGKGMANCPNCGGEIKEMAIECKHCRIKIVDYTSDAELKELDNRTHQGHPQTDVNVEKILSYASDENLSKNNTQWLLISACISYLMAAIFLGLGFHKMFVYKPPDSGYDTITNVYVGGDAYNYIINANYATAYFSLAVFCVIVGLTFILTNYIIGIQIAVNKKL